MINKIYGYTTSPNKSTQKSNPAFGSMTFYMKNFEPLNLSKTLEEHYLDSMIINVIHNKFKYELPNNLFENEAINYLLEKAKVSITSKLKHPKRPQKNTNTTIKLFGPQSRVMVEIDLDNPYYLNLYPLENNETFYVIKRDTSNKKLFDNMMTQVTSKIESLLFESNTGDKCLIYA